MNRPRIQFECKTATDGTVYGTISSPDWPGIGFLYNDKRRPLHVIDETDVFEDFDAASIAAARVAIQASALPDIAGPSFMENDAFGYIFVNDANSLPLIDQRVTLEALKECQKEAGLTADQAETIRARVLASNLPKDSRTACWTSKCSCGMHDLAMVDFTSMGVSVVASNKADLLRSLATLKEDAGISEEAYALVAKWAGTIDLARTAEELLMTKGKMLGEVDWHSPPPASN